MDLMAMIFYAVVCGLLGLAGPRLGTPLLRLGIGVGVGIAAAAILPVIREMTGL